VHPALGLLEFASIAVGIDAGDAMVKRAPLDVTYAGTVHPGKYLVLVGGDTASVEEAMAAGAAVGGEAVRDSVYLPDVHPDVVAALTGGRRPGSDEALGVIETRTVAAVIDAADAAAKGAVALLLEIRLADGLGGKGYVLFGGRVADVEAAVEIGTARIAGSGELVASTVVPHLHPEMAANLWAGPRFRERVATHVEGD
jgi:microcompartment protein CcmL/EutN